MLCAFCFSLRSSSVGVVAIGRLVVKCRAHTSPCHERKSSSISHNVCCWELCSLWRCSRAHEHVTASGTPTRRIHVRTTRERSAARMNTVLAHRASGARRHRTRAPRAGGARFAQRRRPRRTSRMRRRLLDGTRWRECAPGVYRECARYDSGTARGRRRRLGRAPACRARCEISSRPLGSRPRGPGERAGAVRYGSRMVLQYGLLLLA